MSNDVNIKVNVSDGGSTAILNKVAGVLKGTLEGVSIAASSIRVPNAVLAARQGVNAVNMAKAPSRASYKDSSEDLKDYGIARGISGATGAASRDFAKQAQGLGGLVHVYATFAANLFAVSAAFSALSKAADTTNMVKGLDQLGAVSGKSLGSLAKQLSLVTDGAISMRDAMTATVSASAGGMTNAAILRMGIVAKQASQALGIAMPDALSRISRGITKLEPELLDEIGIMVRVDTASQAYARTLNKTASSLTDFEKRQGFANAVLEQGEKKFGAIKLDANPYAKILASMENIAQVGLELVNKVLSPLLTLLSSSPTALATAMGLVGVTLLKQAVPALGAWRENLKNLSIEAGKTAARINTSFAEYQVAQSRKHGDEIEKRIAVEKDAAVRSLNIAKDATKVAGLSKGKVFDITQNVPKTTEAQTAAYKLLDSQIASNTTRGLNLAASDAKAAKSALDRAEALKALKIQLPELIRLEKELERVRNAAEESMHTKPGRLSETWAKEKNARNAQIAASKAQILSNVGENTQVMGIAGAWNQTKADIAEKGLKGIDSTITKVRAGMLIATSTIGTFLNALSGIMMIVGIAVAGFSLLSSWLSTNSKESEKFDNSLTGLTASLDNMSRTLGVIASKDPLAVFSIETIQARANALQELSDSLKSLVKDFKDVQNASSWWDRGIDALWDAIGKGSADKLSTNIAKAISAGLTGAASTVAKSSALSKLETIFGKNIDFTNIKLVNEELRKLSNSEVAAAGVLIDKVLRDISLSANNTATDLANATNRLTELSILIQTQNLTLTPTDAVGKLGTSMLSAASDMSKALKDPINSILVLNKLMDDSKTLSMLSPNISQELISANKEIKDLTASYSRLQSDLAKGEKTLQDLKSTNKAERQVGDLRSDGTRTVVDTQAAKFAKANIAQIKAVMLEEEKKISVAGKELSVKITDDFINVGLNKLNASLKVAMSEGAIAAAKGYLSVLKEAGVGTADAEAKLAQQEIGLQKQILDATYSQIKQQQRNTNALELASVSTRLLTNQLNLADSASSETRRDAALKEKEGLEKELKNVTDKVRLTEMRPQDALKMRAGGDISTEVLSGMAPYLSAITGYLAGQAKLGGAAAAARITGFANIEKEAVSTAQKKNTAKIGDINTELSEVTAAIALSAEYDSILATKKDTLETSKRVLEYTNDQLKTASDLRIIEEASKTGAVSKEKVQEAITAAQKALNDRASKFAADTRLADSEAIKAKLKGLEDIRQKEQSNFDLIRNETQAIYSLKLIQQSDELTFLASIGALTAEASSKAQTDISLKQQSLAFDKQLTEEANKYVTAFIDLENKKQLAGTNTASISSFQKDQDNLVASYLRQAEAASLGNKYKVEGILLAGQQDAILKSQTDQMEKMVSATEGLATIFGDLGNNIGLAGQAILKMAQDDEKYLKNKATLQDKLSKTDNPEEKLNLTKSLGELDKKQAKDELTNIGKISGASKKMFSEKTLAYKVLDGIEKVSAAFKTAMQIKDLAMDFKNFAIRIGLMQAEVPIVAATTAAKTGIELAGQAATMPAKIAGTYASFMSMLGPFGPPAAALAIAAFIGSFASGGGAKFNTAGLTAEDQQKSQGTGQSWKDGKLVANGGGVFGYTDAKSNSIENSIEIIKDNSIEGLTYDNKALSILESINKGIEKTAIALYQTQGISSGSGFGTNEASTSSPGFLGLFSSSRSTEIINSGIKIGGTLANVTANQFEDVLSTRTSSGFFGLGGGTSSSLTKNIKTLGDTATQGLQEIFTNMSKLFVAQGAELGKSSEGIESALASLPIDVTASLKGLRGKELREELGYVLGGIQDDLSTKLFPELVKFKKFGEGMSQTVTRVLDSNKKLELAFASVGINTTRSLDLSETLVNNAGGLDKFLSNIKFFGDNFLTEAQRLAPITTSVTSSMAKVGTASTYASELFKSISDNGDGIINTQEEFTALYSANLALAGSTSENALAAQALLTELDKLAPAYLTTVKALEATQTLREKLLTTEGKSAEVLALTRAKELKGLSDTDAAIVKKIHVQEDLNKTEELNSRLLTLQGKSLEVLALIRAKELKGLSEAEAIIVRKIYAQEDLNKTEELNIRLMNLSGRSVEALVLTRAKELRAASATDKVLLGRIYVLEDINTSIDKTMSTLTNAVSKEKKLLESTKNTAKELVTSLTSVFDLLKAQIIELYNEVASTSTMSSLAATDFINASILTATNTGKLPASSDLSTAITAARKATETNNFSTAVEAERAKLLLANKLVILRDMSKLQLTTAEIQLQVAESQLTTLETLLEEAKDQVDVSKGINTSILSVADALLELAKALKAKTSIPSSTSTPVVGPGGSSNTVVGPGGNGTGASGSDPYKASGYFNEYMLPTGTSSFVGVTDAAKISRLDTIQAYVKNMEWGNPATEAANAVALAEAAKIHGVSQQDLATAMKLPLADTNQFFSAYGVPGFEKGGDHFGGLRIVGENGPEIEATGPSRVFNASQTRGIIQPDNSELVAELRLLRQEVAELRNLNKISADYNKITAKQLVRWDTDGLPATTT